MFSKIDHTTAAHQSYYIASGGTYTMFTERDLMHITSDGSIYFIVDDSANPLKEHVVKIQTLGDATATMAEIYYDSTLSF